jgi:hypothetical protein
MTRIGQLDAARLAVEQLGIDFAFERFDLPAERWRLQTEPLCRPRDVTLFGDSNEVAKLA